MFGSAVGKISIQSVELGGVRLFVVVLRILSVKPLRSMRHILCEWSFWSFCWRRWTVLFFFLAVTGGNITKPHAETLIAGIVELLLHVDGLVTEHADFDFVTRGCTFLPKGEFCTVL